MRDAWVESTLGEVADVIDPHPSHRAPAIDEGGIPFIGIGDLRRTGDIDFAKARRVSKEILEEHKARYNRSDFLIGLGRVASIGMVVRLPDETVEYAVSPTLAVIRAKEMLGPFLFYLLEGDYSQEQFQRFKKGSTRESVGMHILRKIHVLVPPLYEQRRIVDLISSVDSYIEALQQQLESAKKSRNAVLDELLTTGGNDWQQTTLGDIADWGSGGTPKADNPEFYSGDVPWCVIGDLTEREVLKTEKTITKLGLSNSSAKVIAPGSVLLAMYGASIGKTGISAIPMATNQAIAFAKCKTELALPRYLLAYLQSQKSRFVEMGQGAAQPNISQTIIKSWPLTLPPISFQVEVISTIDYFDVHLLNLERSIDASRAVRSSILSDLLSGDHEIPASYDKLMDVAG